MWRMALKIVGFVWISFFVGGERGMRWWQRNGVWSQCYNAHLIAEPLQFIDNIEAAVHDEGIHTASLGAEACHAVTALLRGAEFELEERIVFGADDTEIVGHDERKKTWPAESAGVDDCVKW